jgi:DNA mismatch repair protein MutL
LVSNRSTNSSRFQPCPAGFRAAITEPESNPKKKRPAISVYGFTSRPEVQRPNRNGIYIFVNRRLVRDRLILHAVHEAYRNIVPQGRVSRHRCSFSKCPTMKSTSTCIPPKSKSAFRRSQFVHDFTRDAIRQALMSTRPIASFAAAAGAATGAGNSAPGSGAAPGSSFGTLPAFAEALSASPGSVPA